MIGAGKVGVELLALGQADRKPVILDGGARPRHVGGVRDQIEVTPGLDVRCDAGPHLPRQELVESIDHDRGNDRRHGKAADAILRRRHDCGEHPHSRYAQQCPGFALAGHAQPLVRRVDGTVEAVGTHGTLIGAVPDVTLRDAHFALAPGDLPLLFSDGVTESRRTGEMLGERGLCVLLAGTDDDAEHVCERLALAADADTPVDDIALLAVRARG